MNVTQTNWFATPVWEIQTELTLGKLRSTVKSIRKKDPEGVIFTNVGGWQSNSYPNVCSKYEEDYDIKEPMTPVIEFLNNMADSCATQMGVPKHLKLLNFWFNVNGYKDYNKLHNHRGSFISGVLYILVPDDKCGGITFNRANDESEYFLPEDLVERNTLTSATFTLEPKEGKLILFPSWFRHMVEPSQSRNSRISMSFNYGFTNDDI